MKVPKATAKKIKIVALKGYVQIVLYSRKLDRKTLCIKVEKQDFNGYRQTLETGSW